MTHGATTFVGAFPALAVVIIAYLHTKTRRTRITQSAYVYISIWAAVFASEIAHEPPNTKSAYSVYNMCSLKV